MFKQVLIGNKQYLVSYMEKGKRVKFYVTAQTKKDAIPAAIRNGADYRVTRMSVQELKS